MKLEKVMVLVLLRFTYHVSWADDVLIFTVFIITFILNVKFLAAHDHVTALRLAVNLVVAVLVCVNFQLYFFVLVLVIYYLIITATTTIIFDAFIIVVATVVVFIVVVVFIIVVVLVLVFIIIIFLFRYCCFYCHL